MRCNIAIGLLKEDPKLLIAAMMYLETPTTKRHPRWKEGIKVEEPNLFGGGLGDLGPVYERVRDREYPCCVHGRPFCEECYGPDPLVQKTNESISNGQGGFPPKPEIGALTPEKPETTFETLMNGLDDVEDHLKRGGQ